MEVRNLPEAFILLSIMPGMDSSVRENLNLEYIAEIYQVFGLYDLILKTKELEDMQQIDGIVAKIRQLDGITNSVTMLVRTGSREI
ncbi:MAG: Lrp/AsnC ligand binding domain-containing protein [Promethearchaeota archaeon]